jgi:hypothetical protein
LRALLVERVRGHPEIAAVSVEAHREPVREDVRERVRGEGIGHASVIALQLLALVEVPHLAHTGFALR